VHQESTSDSSSVGQLLCLIYNGTKQKRDKETCHSQRYKKVATATAAGFHYFTGVF